MDILNILCLSTPQILRVREQGQGSQVHTSARAEGLRPVFGELAALSAHKQKVIRVRARLAAA
jgi:hypothetical protein